MLEVKKTKQNVGVLLTSTAIQFVCYLYLSLTLFRPVVDQWRNSCLNLGFSRDLAIFQLLGASLRGALDMEPVGEGSRTSLTAGCAGECGTQGLEFLLFFFSSRTWVRKIN